TSFAGCSGDKGPPPGTLTSTVARKPPPFVTPSGSNGEVLKVVDCSRVTIKYLNIRDGHNPQHSDDGVDFKTSTAGRLFCNCVMNNSITGNGGDPNASVPPDTGACELVSATNNRVDGNQMSGNVTKAGQPSDVCRLISGTGNCGSNIPGAPACAGGATCPAP